MNSTVNIIETNGDNGLVSSLHSFDDNKLGNMEAEAMFKAICHETTDLTADQIECQLTEGFAVVPGGGMVQLVHSEGKK